MKKVLFILFLTIFMGSFLNASTGAAFLDNGISARSEAMGRAFTAVSDDLDAFYYNPAGYGLQDSVQINTLATKINNIYDIYYGGFGTPIWGGYTAVNFYMAAIGDIEEAGYDASAADQAYISETGNSFDYSSYAMFLSYAKNITSWVPLSVGELSLGANFKYINEQLYDNSAKGFGLDLGLLYVVDRFRLGYSIVNFFEPQMQWDTDSGHVDTVERKQQIGVSYRVNNKLLLSLDTVIRKFETVAGIGLEYLVNDMFALRFGTYEQNNTFGLGFNYQDFNFDYVFVQPVEDLVENTHKISVGYTFSTKRPKLKTARTEEPAVISVEAKVVTSAAEEKKEVVEPEPKKSLSLKKKNIVVTEDKVKSYYKLNNNSEQQTSLKVTVLLTNANGIVDKKSGEEYVVAPFSDILIYQPLAEDKKLSPGTYKVKAFIDIEGAETLSYIDQFTI